MIYKLTRLQLQNLIIEVLNINNTTIDESRLGNIASRIALGTAMMVSPVAKDIKKQPDIEIQHDVKATNLDADISNLWDKINKKNPDLPSPSGKPGYAFYSKVSDNDVLPNLLLKKSDYKKNLKKMYTSNGNVELIRLKDFLYGNIANWPSEWGDNSGVSKKTSDGRIILPPEWSVAYEFYLESIADVIDQLENNAKEIQSSNMPDNEKTKYLNTIESAISRIKNLYNNP